MLLYTDSELMTAFGKLDPTISEKALYFGRLFREWGPENELDVTGQNTTLLSLRLRRELGVLNVVFQSYSGKVRFRNKEDMLYMKIKYPEYFK